MNLRLLLRAIDRTLPVWFVSYWGMAAGLWSDGALVRVAEDGADLTALARWLCLGWVPCTALALGVYAWLARGRVLEGFGARGHKLFVAGFALCLPVWLALTEWGVHAIHADATACVGRLHCSAAALERDPAVVALRDDARDRNRHAPDRHASQRHDPEPSPTRASARSKPPLAGESAAQRFAASDAGVPGGASRAGSHLAAAGTGSTGVGPAGPDGPASAGPAPAGEGWADGPAAAAREGGGSGNGPHAGGASGFPASAGGAAEADPRVPGGSAMLPRADASPADSASTGAGRDAAPGPTGSPLAADGGASGSTPHGFEAGGSGALPGSDAARGTDSPVPSDIPAAATSGAAPRVVATPREPAPAARSRGSHVPAGEGAALREGHWVEWAANGQKIFEGRFAGGRREGPCREWYADGAPRLAASYRAGVAQGDLVRWHPNGRLWVSRNELRVEDGTVLWVEDEFDDRGRRRAHQQYRDGLLQGPSRQWHPNGRVSARGGYAVGLRDGAWLFWDESGAMRGHERWAEGQRQRPPAASAESGSGN